MQCVISNCNYNINWQKKELFSHLLERLPKEVTYAYTKEDFKFKRKDLNYKTLKKGKFLYYNDILVTELIFDIDNISHTTAWNLDWMYEVFYKKFNLPITWSCKTDTGIQFCISLDTFYQLTTKQQKLLKDFKKFIANNWELIDKAGSNRLRGWWRNPLTQQDFRYYGNVLSFKEIKEFLFQNKLTIRQQFKAKNRKKLVQNNIRYNHQNNNQKGGKNDVEHKKNIDKKGGVESSIRVTIGEPVKGNRNNFVWYNTMLNCNSKDYTTILKVAIKLNEMCDEKLDKKEVLHIVKNVYRYNQEDKNYIYQNSKKAKWNIGVMGFKKISGLSYEEYIQEVKRRQSMAGKSIGSSNIEKYVRPKAEATKQKVYKAIKELKAQGKRVSALGISKLAGVSRNSATKYLKQAREEGLI